MKLIVMKRLSQRIFGVALAALLAACASGPTIKSDYDRSVDFSQYSTYGFFSPLSIEGPNYSTIYGSVFREAIAREMGSRGYTRSDNSPDLLINVSARLEDKTRVTTTSDPFPTYGYYGYRRGFYDPWMGYGYGTTTHVSQYTEGTVNVDVVDAQAKKMVFEGVAIGRLREDRTNEQVRQAINEGVAKMFEGYPARNN
ncbi:MAG: DUF4136 domain-containing protein [Xanthomonadales bacterium]|nr:DUF4136 domain-containing protein [Xanthomonadales bacterium]